MKRDEKQPELKAVENRDPMPSLITLNEFLINLSKQRTYYHESLGSFAYWIRKDGCPKKWPFQMWKERFDEFLSRKI